MCVKDRVRHYHTLRFPILNDSGKMISFAIVSRDMTESVVLLDEIRQHKEYMENILANSSDMIVTTDLEGRTVTFNPAAEKMLGYRRNEVIGANIGKPLEGSGREAKAHGGSKTQRFREQLSRHPDGQGRP